MGLAVCESYLTRFLDPYDKQLMKYRRSGFGGIGDRIDLKEDLTFHVYVIQNRI